MENFWRRKYCKYTANILCQEHFLSAANCEIWISMQLPVTSSKTLQTTQWWCCCCHIISIVSGVCDLVGSCCSSIYSYVGMCYVRCEYEQCEYSSYIIHLSSGSIKAKAIKKKRKGNTSVALCACCGQNVSSAWVSAPVSRWQSSKLLQNVNVWMWM